MVWVISWIIIPRSQSGQKRLKGENLQENPQIIKEHNEIFQLAMMRSPGDRADQQDCFGFLLKEREGILVVCDGMGGYAAGNLAAETAVRRLLSGYMQQPDSYDPDRYLQTMAQEANRDICAFTDEEGNPVRSGSTLTAVVIQERNLHWVSVGDSRAYLFRNGEYAQITEDHNYLAVLNSKWHAGAIEDREFETQIQKKDILISFLGIGPDMLVDHNIQSLPLRAGDQILLITDGLYRVLQDEEIFRILQSHMNIVEALKELEQRAAETAGRKGQKRDNMTVVLAKIIQKRKLEK